MTTHARMALSLAAIAILSCAVGYDPEVQVQDQDYAEARRHFRTRLTRQGPSPQRDVFALQPPAYVDVVTYAPGLKAWLAMAGHQEPSQKLPAVLFLHGG